MKRRDFIKSLAAIPFIGALGVLDKKEELEYLEQTSYPLLVEMINQNEAAIKRAFYLDFFTDLGSNQ